MAAFSAIGVISSDLPKTLEFFELLGLEIPEGADQAPHVEIDLGGGARLLIDTEDVIKSFDPQWTPPTGSGRIAIALECESPDAVDALYRSVVTAGFDGHVEPWDAVWGQRYAVVHGPDGIAVDLFAASAPTVS